MSARCSICHLPSMSICVDCAIDSGEQIYVCSKYCRREHENACVLAKTEPLERSNEEGVPIFLSFDYSSLEKGIVDQWKEKYGKDLLASITETALLLPSSRERAKRS